MTNIKDNIAKKEWSIKIPIFRTPVILKQLGIAIGIPFGLMITILMIVTKHSLYTLYALGLIVGLFILTYIFIRVVYRGEYDVGFIIDGSGIRCYTQLSQAKTNRIINTLTIILGLLSCKPSVAGAGILAQSRQNTLIKWNRIRKVRYYPRRYTIMISGGITENIGVFCTKENYLEIEELIKSNVKL